MAVGKEAPIPSLCITSAASRAALDEAVSKFAEVCAAIPAAIIRRRIKEADITTGSDSPANGNGHAKAKSK